MSTTTDWTTICESEPLALSGAIQGHGSLIHLDNALNITHAGAQLDAFLPYPPTSLPGKPLPQDLSALLSDALAGLPAEPGSRHDMTATAPGSGALLDFAIIRGADGVVIEITPHQTPEGPVPELPALKPPANPAQMHALHVRMADFFHHLTGFDRVMVYAFREDGDGEVLAESHRPEVYGSYLGLRFPGSDIPGIARALYLQNPWRLIPDSQAAAVPLLGLGDAPPDLTWSDLRSVSPIHQVYLANMGVRASLSFPIVVSGQLWGLIACHHASPRTLAGEVLDAGDRMTKNYGYAILTWQAESRLRVTDSISNALESVRHVLLRHGNLLTALNEIAPDLLARFKACGIAVRVGDDWTQSGRVPPDDVLDELDDWFECSHPESLCTIDSLIRNSPHLGGLPVAGAMSLKINIRKGHSIHFWIFREELLYSIDWGGNPHKPVEHFDGKLDIAPRRSFEKYVEKRLGYCAPWMNDDRLLGLRLRHLLQELYG